MIYYCYRFENGKRREYLCTIDTATEIHLHDVVGAATLSIIGNVDNFISGVKYKVVRREINKKVGDILVYNLDFEPIAQ